LLVSNNFGRNYLSVGTKIHEIKELITHTCAVLHPLQEHQMALTNAKEQRQKQEESLNSPR
jgi:hypothetical protein